MEEINQSNCLDDSFQAVNSVEVLRKDTSYPHPLFSLLTVEETDVASLDLAISQSLLKEKLS